MINGFVKVASASPVLKIADCEYNADIIIDTIGYAENLGVKVLVFPELCITGCTCRDLLNHKVILDSAKNALIRICENTYNLDMLIFVGLPIEHSNKVYSCAAAICNGEVLGIVPKGGIPEKAAEINIGFVHSCFMTSDILFENSRLPELKVAVELGDEISSVDSPSSFHARGGATLIARMADFPETINSTKDTLSCVKADSKRLSSAIVLAAPGRGESSTDNSYSGLCLVSENGRILDSKEYDDCFAVSEIDVEHLCSIRRNLGAFDSSAAPHYSKIWGRELCKTELTRFISKHPHLPDCKECLDECCERILDIQVSGLIKRMEYAHLDHCVVGISGGVDSTLAIMVSAMAIKKMGLPSENAVAVTMPCFGTSSRTKSNAVVVSEQWGCDVRVIDISDTVNSHFDDIGHARDDYSIAFENAQARLRTMVLMDIANKVNGLDVGTEDLSEFIDGWCTYNGDHTSMYDVNMGLTKTQVRAVVAYIAEKTEDKILKAALYDVLDCPVTPELLPIHDDLIEQKSEDAVGSYALQDFFTYNILICGFTPSKTLRLAKYVYGEEFTDEELNRWLTSWCKRLFSQQFKRSCLMDGPSIEAFSVSPRTGFKMPSDAEASMFIKNLEESQINEELFGDMREY